MGKFFCQDGTLHQANLHALASELVAELEGVVTGTKKARGLLRTGSCLEVVRDRASTDRGMKRARTNGRHGCYAHRHYNQRATL